MQNAPCPSPFDFLDLISHINYNGGKQVDYAYNKTGDLVKMDDWTGTTTYEVDLLHQITATTDRLGKHVAYTYDGVGNQTSVSYPDGTVATKEYDLVKNLTKVTEEDGRTTTYEYDGMRRVTHMNYPDGWQEDYHYDAIGQLLAIEDTDPTQKDMKQQKNTFEYDVCGNMTHEYMRGNGTGETTTDVTYTYDELHRVTSAHELYGNTWRNYQYDSLSNLTYENNSNNVHYDYKLNNLNQLVQKSYSSNDKEGTLYTYDKRGNLVKEEYGKLNGNENGQKRQTVAEYVYDETNKMVEGTNSIGESSSYLFNGRNALVEQTWHIAKNGYGYHDVDATAEDLDAIIELTSNKGGNGSGGKGHGNGNGQGNGNGAGDKPTGTTVGSFSTVIKQFVVDYTVETMDPLMEHEVNGLDYRYVYGNERLSVNISPIPNGAGHIVESGTVGQQIRLYYHQDLRGTVDYLTSPVSQKVESWTHYNEWGEITHNAVLKTGQRELDLVKNYTGHDFDAVLNMYYAKARMYDAENRRFVSIDPILDGTKYDLKDYTTEAINFTAYVYVRDNPLRWIDPFGLMVDADDNWGTSQHISATPKSVLVQGSTGESVKELQTLLVQYGYLNGTSDIDGFFGPNTDAAVREFQRKNGLANDGSVGPRTWEKLSAAEKVNKKNDKYVSFHEQVAINQYNSQSALSHNYQSILQQHLPSTLLKQSFIAIEGMAQQNNLYNSTAKAFTCIHDTIPSNSLQQGNTVELPQQEYNSHLDCDDTSWIVNAGNYIGRSVDQVVRGNYSENVTLLGTGGQIFIGVVGVDLPADVRDIVYDITHWEKSWKHVGQTVIDVISILPAVGFIKYSDEAGALLKHTDEVGDLLKHTDEVGDVLKHTDDVADILKHGDEVGDALKHTDEAADILKHADEAGDVAGKGYKAFTGRNFRHNLIVLTGEVGDNAHHVFPQKFRAKFSQLGIQIDNPKYGAWVTKGLHQSWSNNYNKAWQAFFDTTSNPSVDEIMDFARKLAIEYGFELNF